MRLDPCLLYIASYVMSLFALFLVYVEWSVLCVVCVLFVCCSLFVVRCLLLVVRRALSVAGCGLFWCSLFVARCFLFLFSRLKFGVWCLVYGDF